MQSAYMNQVSEREEDDDKKENSNIYCINNKDMSNASKIRFIKRIEQANAITNTSNAKDDKEGERIIESLSNLETDRVFVFPKNFSKENEKIDLINDTKKTQTTITENSISFLQNLERGFKKSNSLKPDTMWGNFFLILLGSRNGIIIRGNFISKTS